VDGATHYWHLLDGDKCHELSVENANGEVGAVSLGTYDKIMAQYQRCVTANAGAAPPDGEPPTDEAAADDGGW
jgi:hypothetical protein